MLISGVQKFTMLDYPQKVACIIFTAGCNFRCGFCHNPEFVLPENLQKIKDSFIPEDAFFNFLNERKGLLDGVVISGGEPTIMPDLPNFIEKIKKLDFLVKLDTNGNNPSMLKNLIDKKMIDYVAMDIKTSLEEYKNLVGNLANTDNIEESISIIKNSCLPYEFRSTILKETHSIETLKKMNILLKGTTNLYLQQFRPKHTLEKVFENYQPYTKEEMEEMAKNIFTGIVNVQVR